MTPGNKKTSTRAKQAAAQREKGKKYEDLVKRIYAYCHKHNFYEIISDMLHQTFMNGNDKPYNFMAEYLVNLNNKDTLNGDHPVLLEDQQNVQEMARLKRQIQIKNEEIKSLTRHINAFERQLGITPRPSLICETPKATTSSYQHENHTPDNKTSEKPNRKDSGVESVLRSSDSESEAEAQPAQSKKPRTYDVKLSSDALEAAPVAFSELQSSLQLSEDSEDKTDDKFQTPEAEDPVVQEIIEKSPACATSSDSGASTAHATNKEAETLQTPISIISASPLSEPVPSVNGPAPSVIDFTQLIATTTEKKFIEPVAQCKPDAFVEQASYNEDSSDGDSEDLVIDERRKNSCDMKVATVRANEPQPKTLNPILDTASSSSSSSDDSDSDSAKQPLHKKLKLETLHEVIDKIKARAEPINVPEEKKAEKSPEKPVKMEIIQEITGEVSTVDENLNSKDSLEIEGKVENRTESIEEREIIQAIERQLRQMQSPEPQNETENPPPVEETVEVAESLTAPEPNPSPVKPEPPRRNSLDFDDTLDLDYEADDDF